MNTSYIWLIVGVFLFVVISSYLCILFMKKNGFKTDIKMRKDTVRNFIGGDLYAISLNQLERYFIHYRVNPNIVNTRGVSDFVKAVLGGQIARQLTDEDLDQLIANNSLFSVDDVVKRLDIDEYVPAILEFATTGRVPLHGEFIARPFVVGRSTFYINREIVMLLDIINAREIERKHLRERKNA